MLDGVSRWLVLAAGLLLAVTAGARFRVEALRVEASEAAELSREAGLAFTEDFEPVHQESELRLLDQRRELVQSAMRWHALGSVSFALALVSLFASWVARQLVRAGFEEELEDSAPPAPRA